jgi:hypothetical protein
VIAKALGKAVRWKLPNDQDAARALQSGETGLTETPHFAHQPRDGHAITGTMPLQRKRRAILNIEVLQEVLRRWTQPMMNRPDPVKLAFVEAGSPPVITWPGPDPIAYGEKLTSAQLNATASVEGTLIYTPGPRLCAAGGNAHALGHIHSGRFRPLRPAAGRNFNCCDQGNAGHFLAKTCTMIYGTALDAAQLNASAQVPGKFDYSPAAGEVLPPGKHTLSVVFTPADGANYATAQATVPVTVAKAASPSNGRHPIRLHTAHSSATRSSVPWHRFRERSNTAPGQERCLRQESIDCRWFSILRILWPTLNRRLPFH